MLHCKVLVVIAGIPEELSNRIHSKINSLQEGRRKIVFLPMAKRVGYSNQYISDLYDMLVREVGEIIPINFRNENAPVWFEGVLIIYVKYDIKDEKRFLQAFGQETLISNIQVSRLPIWDLRTPNKCRQAINVIGREVRKAIRVGEKVLPIIKKYVTSNQNNTPLLLPFNNFDESDMIWLRDRVMSATTGIDPRDELGATLRTFEGKVRRVKFGADQFSSFSNKNGLVFRRPSAAHGDNGTLGEGHNVECQIRGRLRFGVTINPRFHYDCVQERGKLSRHWRSCHNQMYTVRPGREHVNIAPNDHVR